MIGIVYWIIIGLAVVVIVVADRRADGSGAVEVHAHRLEFPVPPHPVEFVRVGTEDPQDGAVRELSGAVR